MMLTLLTSGPDTPEGRRAARMMIRSGDPVQRDCAIFFAPWELFAADGHGRDPDPDPDDDDDRDDSPRRRRKGDPNDSDDDEEARRRDAPGPRFPVEPADTSIGTVKA